MWLVCYDISSGYTALRKIAKICESAGIRVQYSVFEIDISDANWVKVKSSLEAVVGDCDSLRYYAVNPENSYSRGKSPELSSNNCVL